MEIFQSKVKYFSFALLLSAVTLTSCTKEDIKPHTEVSQLQLQQNIPLMLQGDWEMSSRKVDGIETIEDNKDLASAIVSFDLYQVRYKESFHSSEEISKSANLSLVDDETISIDYNGKQAQYTLISVNDTKLVFEGIENGVKPVYTFSKM